VAYIVFGVLFL